MIIHKYNYKRMDRKTIDSKRYYAIPDGNHVVSVTTILSATQSEDKKATLENWRKRIGYKEAEKITSEAAERGTDMHAYLEQYCLTGHIETHDKRTTLGFEMANVTIQEGLKYLDECWGVEASLYYNRLYAGTTDCIGLYKNTPAIVDFKQTNKPKKREWIDDYFMQLTAYGEAHNNMFDTNIKTGVILMCCQDFTFQEFVLHDKEWDKYKNRWFDKVKKYYSKEDTQENVH